MTKLRVGVIFGGKSAEHEVSLQSAKNIVDAIDKEKFDVTLLGIDKQGQWHINDASNYLLNAENPALIALNRSNKNVALIPGRKQQLIEAAAPARWANWTLFSRSCTARWGRTARCRGCCAWPICRSSAPACSARRSAWIKT